MNDPSRAALATLVNTLNGTANLVEGTIAWNDSDPAPGSPASSEREHEDEFAVQFLKRPVYDAHGFGLLAMFAVTDHLRAVARLLVPPPPSIWAPTTIVRTIVELSARARWMLDPSIEVRERLARFMTENLYSIWETQRAGLTMKDGTDPESRVEQIIDWAGEHDYTVVESSRLRGQYGIESFRPSSSKVILTQLGDFARSAFAVYSPVSHSVFSGLIELVEAEPDGTGRITVPMARLQAHTAASLLVMGEVVPAMLALYGWRTTDWDAWWAHNIRRFRPLVEAMTDPVDAADG